MNFFTRFVSLVRENVRLIYGPQYKFCSSLWLLYCEYVDWWPSVLSPSHLESSARISISNTVGLDTPLIWEWKGPCCKDVRPDRRVLLLSEKHRTEELGLKSAGRGVNVGLFCPRRTALLELRSVNRKEIWPELIPCLSTDVCSKCQLDSLITVRTETCELTTQHHCEIGIGAN